MNPMVKKRLRIIAILTTIIWMGVIFLFSADNGVESHELSDKCLKFINQSILVFTGKNLELSISPEHYAMIEFYLRKMAHMFIYLILSINIMIVLFTFNMNISSRILLTTIICFGYAITDEFHQSFVGGRSARFLDCLIDTGGAIIGVFISLILYCILYTIMTKYQKKTGIVTSKYK
ncbi:VanZ like family protein [Clostridiales bacterium CHKCI006]|nr:VanZ like family protein [Clostridiales bacterium CHKCI006]